MRFIACRSPVKPCLIKYFKWLLKVTKGQKLGEGYIVFRPDHEGHIRSPKGTVPFSCGLVRTMVINQLSLSVF